MLLYKEEKTKKYVAKEEKEYKKEDVVQEEAEQQEAMVVDPERVEPQISQETDESVCEVDWDFNPNTPLVRITNIHTSTPGREAFLESLSCEEQERFYREYQSQVPAAQGTPDDPGQEMRRRQQLQGVGTLERMLTKTPGYTPSQHEGGI